MMPQRLKIWYHPEGDFLEVLFSDKPGFMRETNDNRVMERVDDEGNILGFSVMQISKLKKEEPLVAGLA